MPGCDLVERLDLQPEETAVADGVYVCVAHTSSEEGHLADRFTAGEIAEHAFRAVIGRD